MLRGVDASDRHDVGVKLLQPFWCLEPLTALHWHLEASGTLGSERLARHGNPWVRGYVDVLDGWLRRVCEGYAQHRGLFQGALLSAVSREVDDSLGVDERLARTALQLRAVFRRVAPEVEVVLRKRISEDPFERETREVILERARNTDLSRAVLHLFGADEASFVVDVSGRRAVSARIEVARAATRVEPLSMVPIPCFRWGAALSVASALAGPTRDRFVEALSQVERLTSELSLRERHWLAAATLRAIAEEAFHARPDAVRMQFPTSASGWLGPLLEVAGEHGASWEETERLGLRWRGMPLVDVLRESAQEPTYELRRELVDERGLIVIIRSEEVS